MLFNSVPFLIFFPIVVLFYFVLPHKVRWVWLLITSYFFYMCWNPQYALLMATSTVITYLSGLLIEKAKSMPDEKRSVFYKKLWVALSFTSNLAILVFFKYFGFIVTNINAVLGALNLQVLTPSFDVLLPVGISFYTFQALSYTMDVYRGEIYAEKNLGKYALFVSFFPQLVAGPIERSKHLLKQINERHYFDVNHVKNGLLRMMWGFFEKLVIADRAAVIVNTIFNNYTEYSGVQIGLAVVLFAVQIYCDFSGYSDIAIGAAEVMGFRLMENFRQPYFATSIKDFWRRWHISLSTWFRDYLYIPLGGNRCSKAKQYRNMIITFLLSGLWHGASWNYVIWGGLHGLYQLIGGLTAKSKKKLYSKINLSQDSFSFRLGQIFTTFILVNLSWIFFRATSGREAFEIIRRLFMEFNFWTLFDGSILHLGLDTLNVVSLFVAIAVLVVVDLLRTKVLIRQTLARQNMLFRWVVYIGIILVVLLFGFYGQEQAQSQFIYFQF